MADQDGSFRAARQCSPLVKDVDDELAGLEPFTEEAKRAEEDREFERELERFRKENEVDLQHELKQRLLDFDPKLGGQYYTRFHFVDLRTFDLDEESPLGPMRYTNVVLNKDKVDYPMWGGINIFSVKISCSDVGFPIHVYGTVIARDSIDEKCIYLFRCDRDHCQTITSEDESALVLTGPKRGLALISYDYIETDLKIKGHQGEDRELSKGYLMLKCASLRSMEKCEVESLSLATRLSTVEVTYEFVPYAVEGTIAIEVIQGCFDGQITAHTTSIQNTIVLYDREVMTSNDTGLIKLMRPVVSVSMRDMLVIVTKTRDGKAEGTIEFTPRFNGAEEDVTWVGGARIRVKVTWSVMSVMCL